MENTAQRVFVLKDFYTLVFRYKTYIGLIFMVTLISVGIGVHFLTEIYEAKAGILVKIGRENLSPMSIFSSNQYQVVTGGLRKEDINSEIKILKNRRILEKVIEELGVNFLYPAPEKPDSVYKIIKSKIKQTIKTIKNFVYEILYRLKYKKRLPPHQKALLTLEKRVSVEQLQNSDIIEVIVGWESADIARTILSTLLDFFYDAHMLAHKNSGGYKLIQDQAALSESRLVDLEKQLQDLKAKQGITRYEQQERQLLEQLASLKAAYRNTEIDISEATARRQTLEIQLVGHNKVVLLSKQIARNPILDTLKTKLLELKIEREHLKAKYIENSPPVLEIEQKINRIKNRFAQESVTVDERITNGVNTTYKEIELELLSQESSLASLEQKQIKLEEHIAIYTKELGQLKANHLKLVQLERQIRLSEDTYAFYRKRLEEARVAEVQDNQKIINTRTINPVSVSYLPVRPKKLKILGLAMAVSLMAGIGFALVLDYLDQSIRSVEDVQQYLALPTLTSIGEVNHDIYDIEQIEGLQNKVLQINSSSPLQTIMVTGSLPEEGCTTIAVNLAIRLAANLDVKVLLVDANFQESTHIFQINGSEGLRDILTADADSRKLICETRYSNLSFLCSGSNEKLGVAPEPEQLKRVLSELEAHYDYLVIDSSPMNMNGVTQFLASQVDGVILMVHAGQTRWQVAQVVKKRLDEASANILGVVLNRRKYDIPGFIYDRL